MSSNYVLSPYIKFLLSSGDSYKLANYITNKIEYVTREEFDLIRKCKIPFSLTELKINKHARIEWLIKRLILINELDMWTLARVRHVEIETSTVCNWKCVYCPNVTMNRKPQYMPMDLFDLIMKKVDKYPYIQYVTLHGYNEPTIDPNFTERIKLIGKYNKKLVLFTNGTGLNDYTLGSLKHLCQVRNIIFNIPSSNEHEFKQLTGVDNYHQTIAAIRLAERYGFSIKLSVQCLVENQHIKKAEIEKIFPFLPVLAAPSFDRGGYLKNNYFRNINVETEKLDGCSCMISVLHLAINGDMYLCLEDVQKKYRFGNIINKEVSELLLDKKWIEIKKIIWGGKATPNKFICKNCAMITDQNHGEQLI